MLKQFVIGITLITFINFVIGCEVKETHNLLKEEIQLGTDNISVAVLKNGTTIYFDDKGGVYQSSEKLIVGFNNIGQLEKIKVDDILYVRIDRVDTGLSTLATFGVIVGVCAGIALIAFLILAASSCPFIYSWDGERYVFDAEPLGGSITSGLAKTDYSRLDYLKPKNGKYELLVRNEMRETQYLNMLKLMVIDHSTDCKIVPDINGKMHAVYSPVSPIKSFDENGMDLINFIKAQDEIMWQTAMPIDSSFVGQPLRHTLTFQFPKPKNVKSARLIVKAGTAIWGSNMIRKMLELRGNKIDDWYHNVNSGKLELIKLAQFIERDELFVLKINVKEGDTWAQRGYIRGSGPMLSEDRIIPIDLSHVQSDTVTIQLHPPKSYWTLDYIGIDYEDDQMLTAQELPVTSAFDFQDRNVLQTLNTIDHDYYIMQNVGDWLKVQFDIPPKKEGMQRSIFLKTNGYYEIHLDKNASEQTELINKILSTPGMIVEYGLHEYLKWRAGKMASMK